MRSLGKWWRQNVGGVFWWRTAGIKMFTNQKIYIHNKLWPNQEQAQTTFFTWCRYAYAWTHQAQIKTEYIINRVVHFKSLNSHDEVSLKSCRCVLCCFKHFFGTVNEKWNEGLCSGTQLTATLSWLKICIPNLDFVVNFVATKIKCPKSEHCIFLICFTYIFKHKDLL